MRGDTTYSTDCGSSEPALIFPYRGSPKNAEHSLGLQRKVYICELAGSAALFVFFGDGAFVPVTQQQARHEIEDEIDNDAGHRQEKERGEQARDREAVAGFEDAEGKPGFGSSGAGDEFGDDCADERDSNRQAGGTARAWDGDCVWRRWNEQRNRQRLGWQQRADGGVTGGHREYFSEGTGHSVGHSPSCAAHIRRYDPASCAGRCDSGRGKAHGSSAGGRALLLVRSGRGA